MVSPVRCAAVFAPGGPNGTALSPVVSKRVPRHFCRYAELGREADHHDGTNRRMRGASRTERRRVVATGLPIGVSCSRNIGAPVLQDHRRRRMALMSPTVGIETQRLRHGLKQRTPRNANGAEPNSLFRHAGTHAALHPGSRSLQRVPTGADEGSSKARRGVRRSAAASGARQYAIDRSRQVDAATAGTCACPGTGGKATGRSIPAAREFSAAHRIEILGARFAPDPCPCCSATKM